LPDGTVSHIVGTWQDITEKRKLRDASLKRRQPREQHGLGDIIGISAPMQEVYERIAKIIDTDVKTVLILGETGTGKDLVAATIHALSSRKDHPFVEINCKNAPEGLLESELFGHEKGTFADAKVFKRGLFERAPVGTILLNEIGHMKLDLQAKLISVIEQRKFRRVGGGKDLYLDVRLLAATSGGLRKAVKKGEFREDLYYRIKGVPIYLPPLRERTEDFLLLIKHFIELANDQFIRNVQGITKEAQDLMMRYDWPGNVREVKNVVERVVVMGDGDRIQAKDLPREIGRLAKRTKDVSVRFKLLEEGAAALS
jgi:transcriptional regulator with PAS, ATPase and Fis domain